MHGVRRLMAITTTSWLLLTVAACQDRRSDNTTVSAEESDQSAGQDANTTDRMTADDAIKLVKLLAAKGNLRATVNQPYIETRTERSACGEAEIVYDMNTYPQNPERRLCKSVTGKMPFYKYTTYDDPKCCHKMQVKLPPDARWVASSSANDGSWHLTGYFNIEGSQHHAIWVVDSRTKEVVGLPGDRSQ